MQADDRIAGGSCEGCPDFVYMTTTHKTCRNGGNPCPRHRRQDAEQEQEEHFRLEANPDCGDPPEIGHRKGYLWPSCRRGKQNRGRHR